MKERSEREKQFDALERFRAKLTEHDEDDVLADATEAVEAVRKARHGEEGASPPSGVTIEEMGGEAPCQLPRFWDADD